MGLLSRPEAPASAPPAPSGVWRAVETLATQVMADLVERPLEDTPSRRHALEEATRELQTALGALATTQTQLLAHQESLATLGRLAAELAHELKNPLTVLQGELQLLARELERHPPEETGWLRHHLGHLQKATARIVRLVSSLSAASKPPRPEHQPMAVAPLLEDTHELVAPLARDRHVAVAVEPEPGLHVTGDRSQLLEILLNLATNAVEAMAGGGALTLRARGEGAEVVLEVTDTGPGIPPELQTRIFDPFFTTKAEGTGLGLAIARRLAEVHGGSLSLASQPGTGTTARLRLPAAAPALAARP